jgi:hypothetical protein
MALVGDVERVDRWAARHRADLSRLRLAARSAQRRAERAERSAGEVRTEVEVPGALVSVVDAMLDRAVRQADLAVDAARRHAAATVALEHQRATEHRRARGVDALVEAAPPAWSSEAVPEVTRPASGLLLWERVANGEWSERAPDDAPAADDAAADDRESVAEVALVLDEDGDLHVALDGAGLRPQDQPPRALVPDRPVAAAVVRPTAGDDGVLFDMFWRGPEDVFWGEAESSWRGEAEVTRRPLRGRRRRRVLEGPA